LKTRPLYKKVGEFSFCCTVSGTFCTGKLSLEEFYKLEIKTFLLIRLSQILLALAKLGQKELLQRENKGKLIWRKEIFKIQGKILYDFYLFDFL
jgi:hypothetical protein